MSTMQWRSEAEHRVEREAQFCSQFIAIKLLEDPRWAQGSTESVFYNITLLRGTLITTQYLRIQETMYKVLDNFTKSLYVNTEKGFAYWTEKPPSVTLTACVINQYLDIDWNSTLQSKDTEYK